MARDVEQLLRTTADAPSRPLDTGEVVNRARGQTRWLRVGLGVTSVAVVALASLLVWPLVGEDRTDIEVAERPDAAVDASGVEDLAGLTFVASQVVEDGTERDLVADGESRTELRVEFDPSSPMGGRPEQDLEDEGVESDTWFTWYAGCNHHDSAVVLDGGRVDLLDQSTVTTQRCPDERAEQDAWLRDFFGASPTWELDGDALELAEDDTVIVLEGQ